MAGDSHSFLVFISLHGEQEPLCLDLDILEGVRPKIWITRNPMSFLAFGVQSISPGMVDTDLLNVYESTVYAQLPKLSPADVTAAVLYALSTSEFVQVKTRIDDKCISTRSKQTLNGPCNAQRSFVTGMQWYRLTDSCLFCRSRKLFCRRCSSIDYPHSPRPVRVFTKRQHDNISIKMKLKI